jgi:hypothetical protein
MTTRAYPHLPYAKNALRTRADVQQLVRDLTAPILPHFSAGRAHVVLGENRAHYGDPAGFLEGYARPLWGLVPLAAGGGTFDHWEFWQRGLENGTDPSHPEYWGVPGDYDQRSVEQAAFGFALALAPQIFWEPLSQAAKGRVVAWLRRINEVKLVRSNWLFFRVLVNLGLAKCGQDWAAEQVEADLQQIDAFYVGNGWYEDGLGGPPYRDGRRGDYYVPMALQFYALVYGRLAPEADPARIARYVERARHFAEDFVYYFAEDGSALPFGRSLSYRFAQGAFWGSLAYAAVEALPWGVIKGLYLRHLRWWMQQPIFTETGLLTIGYSYPNLHMAESYNSAGSPYWAFKAFLPLALPESHPFWRAEEAALPPRKAVHSVPEANLILTTRPGSRDVTAITPGQPVFDWPRTAPHKYSKCAYDTRFGFNVPAGVATLAEGGLDNGISVSDDNRFFRVREHCEAGAIKDGVAYSRWSPWPAVVVETWLIADPECHVRIHRLSTDRKVWVIDGGFPVGYQRKRDVLLEPRNPVGPIAKAANGASCIRILHGEREPAAAELGANSSLMFSLSAMPFLRSAHEAGEHWLACVVAASADRDARFDHLAEYTIAWENNRARVFRKQNLWWSMSEAVCGTSTGLRLAALERPV